MLRPVLSFLTTLLIAGSALAAVTVGEPAPAFSGTDVLSGEPISNESLKGKTVVLEWNNPDCPFVKKFYSVGAMQALQAKAARNGVVWVGINSSAAGKEGYLKDAAQAKAALAERQSNTRHYLLDHDGRIGHAYAAKTTPHMFIIDPQGILVYQGAIDNKPSADTADIATATNYVTEALNALKHGKPIKTATTQPYGCFIKY
ncbi:MAG: redoxin family protein [Alphaproteobacteria bacterium]|nr:redoxin family protein [Alphaproteobacteria bacterium]